MEFVERFGVRLAYERMGGGAVGLDAPSIVFVHGWSCDRSYFAPQMEYFAERHAVAALDLTGHGDSDRPDPSSGRYSIDGFADDVLAVIEAVGFDAPVVIGHSMGAFVALAVAARGARAAVLVDSAGIATPVESIRAFASAVAADEDGSWTRRFVARMFLPTDRVRRDETIEAMSSRPREIASACIRSWEHFDGRAALASCAVPVLSIGAARPNNSGHALVEAKPDIVIAQTACAGHFNMLEVPEQVNAMIEKFLAVALP